jgi:hypothetical protein
MLADSSSAVRVEEISRVPCAVGYEGGHWLGSFAVYLVTKKGIPQKCMTSGRSRGRLFRLQSFRERTLTFP